jgi:hypothetical protein
MEAETTLNRSYTYFHRKVREQRLMVVSCKSQKITPSVPPCLFGLTHCGLFDRTVVRELPQLVGKLNLSAAV